ncbi:MAG: PKD domain-containing protein, partial [Methanospirillum sp.]|uniref:PKD domain-containing protein n=1 Tax=Methanospirillum sp. TaxID=45200 RepID=UPI002374F633
FITVEEKPAPPVARFKSDRRMGTAPLGVHFESLASGVVSSWNWDLGDGTISSEKDPVVTYTKPGVYTITQTVTGPGGKDVAVRRAYITVSAPVTPPVAVIYAEPVEGAAPLTVKFLDMSTGLVTGWHWDLGDGALSTNKNPTHIYQTEGTYTVKLKVSGPNGDSNTETTIRVSPHEQKIRKIGFIPDPEPVIQQKPVVQVSDDVATTNITDGTETPAPVSKVQPVASFSLSGRSGKSPLTITFHDRSSGDPTGWLWDFGDNATSELKDPIHTYENPGVYSINLTVTSAGGSSQKLIREAVQVF